MTTRRQRWGHRHPVDSFAPATTLGPIEDYPFTLEVKNVNGVSLTRPDLSAIYVTYIDGQMTIITDGRYSGSQCSEDVDLSKIIEIRIITGKAT